MITSDGLILSTPAVLFQHLALAGEMVSELQLRAHEMLDAQGFADWCARCEAHLDALRLERRESVRLGQGRIEEEPELGAVLAILIAERDSTGPGDFQDRFWPWPHESQEIRRAVWSGLRLADVRRIEAELRTSLRAASWDFPAAAALDILAFHRLPVVVDWGKPVVEEGDEVSWLLVEAAGRTKKAWSGELLQRFASHASPRVREAAWRASARCGLAGLPAQCRGSAGRRGEKAAEALRFLGVVGEDIDLPLLQSAVSNGDLALAALDGIGRLGLANSVPFLLDAMEVAELAEPAAAAFWRITGAEAPRDPEPEPPEGVSEEDWELRSSGARVDLVAARAWWKVHGSRFDAAKRWHVGRCVSDRPLGPVFEELPLGVRDDVYLRERSRTPGTPDWELETWSWKQKNPGS